MGFPFEDATWEGVSGPIFMGFGTAMPGIWPKGRSREI